MYSTTYHRPSSIDEAAALFAKARRRISRRRPHVLIPVMKAALASPSDVSISAGQGLMHVEVSGDSVTIKAATTHYDVASNGAAQKAIPALAHLAR